MAQGDWQRVNVAAAMCNPDGTVPVSSLDTSKTYEYDANGNMIRITYVDPVRGFTWKKEYTYDSSGNVLTETAATAV